ncbi:MAG: hypothetical protein AB1631_02255 [Acidobacteriota bacterium]
MKKKLFMALFCMLVLPFICPVSQTHEATNIAPFNTVAIAGRTIMGGFCDCGCPGCICDPEEEPNCGYGLVARDSSETGSAPETGDTGFDPASSVLLVALFFLAAVRFRAC